MASRQRFLRNAPPEARQGPIADVAKLVDARDLKSLDFGHTGSIPVVRTICPYFIQLKSLVNLGCHEFFVDVLADFTPIFTPLFTPIACRKTGCVTRIGS